MTKQTINIGSPPGGTDGDTARSGFTKVNLNFDELYTRAQAKLSKDVSGAEGTVALSIDEALNGIIDLTGVLTGPRIVTVPASPPQPYTVRNRATGAALTFQTSSGTGIVIPTGQTAVLYSDGLNIVDPIGPAIAAAVSGLSFPGRLLGFQVFTSSGTYTPSTGTASIVVEIQGAGGAGGGAPTSPGGTQVSGGGSGGAGGYVKHRMTSGFSGAAVVVGAAGGAGTGATGGTGGASSFAGIVAAGGGGGVAYGPASVIAVSGGAGGAATGGNIVNAPGQPGLPANGVGAIGVFISAPGAMSMMGGGGLQGRGTSPGAAARGFGSGGGGTILDIGSGVSGGAGAPGVVIVWEYR